MAIAKYKPDHLTPTYPSPLLKNCVAVKFFERSWPIPPPYWLSDTLFVFTSHSYRPSSSYSNALYFPPKPLCTWFLSLDSAFLQVSKFYSSNRLWFKWYFLREHYLKPVTRSYFSVYAPIACMTQVHLCVWFFDSCLSYHCALNPSKQGQCSLLLTIISSVPSSAWI